MVRRHPLPSALPLLWLFSDERLNPSVDRLAALLPPGSGIVVRHDALGTGARWRLVRRLIRTARARRLSVWVAGPPALARRWGADGAYVRHPDMAAIKGGVRAGLPIAIPVHDLAEAGAARRAGAAVCFISPLFPTRSHPGAPALGRSLWLRLARLAGGVPIALGGMDASRARTLRRAAGAQGVRPGWAAIDGMSALAAKRTARRRSYQKRNAVPT
ncbi:MAG: thiamine phosphate synthase [Sphingopyxis sp.]|uniref:thiamine phosphate synthase n=1 Tax=Sphingopyxis sp. TaxID=1908224 RepID=UPI002ABAAE6E|nr:thiamine phosphate synthase [Sphingopyxis sp.]MDZ3832141.1 thiamine phosphate synthase [Sphingopyxis sp.]